MDQEPLDLLTELVVSEDEFDVDLMAAGCRVRVCATDMATTGPEQLLSLYGFGADELLAVIGTLMSEGVVDVQTLFRVCEHVANGTGSSNTLVE